MIYIKLCSLLCMILYAFAVFLILSADVLYILYHQYNQDQILEKYEPRGFCKKCTKNEICLNVAEDRAPTCKTIIDKKDPTGCGGLCMVNKEYCQLLDEDKKLFQCRKLHHILNCTNLFSCGNMCISHNLRCDGIFHCVDGSDEIGCECDLTKQFQCGNATGCLDLWKKCDGKVDCWDHSDETNCVRRLCNKDEIACRNGKCIKIEQFCDGVVDCSDKTDEPSGCERTTISHTGFGDSYLNQHSYNYTNRSID